MRSKDLSGVFIVIWVLVTAVIALAFRYSELTEENTRLTNEVISLKATHR